MPNDEPESPSFGTRHSALGIALETSGRNGSVALARGGVVLAERTYPHGLMHAAAIVPLLDELFRSHGARPADAREIYVSIGPGSFTGLRVGVTLAKTLAFATGARLVAVPSVRVLAENAPAEARTVVVALDAKRGQVFTATFGRSAAGAWVEREPARLDRLADALARTPRPVHVLGEGVPFHAAAIPADVTITDASTWQARAGVVATLGHAMARGGASTDAFALAPTYVRLPEAEEKRLIVAGLLSPDGTPLPS